MSKKIEDQRKHPEFLFVFNNNADQSKSVTPSENEQSSSSSLSEDVAKTHRDKLLAELRDYGC